MPKLPEFHFPNKADWVLPPSEDAQGEAELDGGEYVRQWLVQALTRELRFPTEWLGDRITLEDVPELDSNGRSGLGVHVKNALGDVYLVLAVAPDTTVAKSEEGFREHLRKLPYAAAGAMTDVTGKHQVMLKRRFDQEGFEYVAELQAYQARPIEQRKPFVATSDHTMARTLRPMTQRIESLFFEIHSHLRDIDGIHPDEALDELCKLIYTKLYDEDTTGADKPFRLQETLYGTTDELASTVRRLYEAASETDSRDVTAEVVGNRQSRGVFETPMRISGPAIAMATRALQGVSLSSTKTDIKGRAFQKVLGPAVRAGMGQYFTPDQVVAFAVSMVRPTIDELVLDPFCGSGRFLSASLDLVGTSRQAETDADLRKYAFGQLHGIEKSERMVRVAMTDMRLHGDGHSHIRCADSLLPFENYADLTPESFDVVLTNPPFGSVLGREARAQLGRFTIADQLKSVPLEVLGLERCVQFLRPGGRMAIVLPDGLLDNRRTKYVRDWASQHARVAAIVSLPIETFTPFGANIKTSIVVLRKWFPGEDRSLDYDVFVARVDEVGHDSSGRPTGQSDLQEVSDAFRSFLDDVGW